MEDVFFVLGAIVVLGGGAWAGAKAAFLTTLFFKVLFGKASEPPQPQVVYVPVSNGVPMYGDVQMYNTGDRVYAQAVHGRRQEPVVIDVTPYK